MYDSFYPFMACTVDSRPLSPKDEVKYQVITLVAMRVMVACKHQLIPWSGEG